MGLDFSGYATPAGAYRWTNSNTVLVLEHHAGALGLGLISQDATVLLKNPTADQKFTYNVAQLQAGGTWANVKQFSLGPGETAEHNTKATGYPMAITDFDIKPVGIAPDGSVPPSPEESKVREFWNQVKKYVVWIVIAAVVVVVIASVILYLATGNVPLLKKVI